MRHITHLTLFLKCTIGLSAVFYWSKLHAYSDGLESLPIEWHSIPTPPRFIHKPNSKVAYFAVNNRPQSMEAESEDKPRVLNCKAVGIPQPTYEWHKDGKLLPANIDVDRVVRSKEDGSITFLRFEERDQGVYQCLSSNDNGTALSETTSVEKAWQNHFVAETNEETRNHPQVVRLELGDPYSRNCTPPDSNPPAMVFWLLASASNPSEIQAINSSHISSNERGTIFFHYVSESDFKENQLYTCTAYNKELQEYKQSSNQFNFEIQRNRRDKLHMTASQEQYVNQSSPIALLGTIHKLHCFFSGYPEPIPTWYRNGEEILASNTRGFIFENFGRTLAFNVTMEHFGRYECKFQRESLDRRFDVKVNAAPYWHDHPPANTNTSEGETVVFDCKAKGHPTPQITFYKNGVEMKKPRPGENWIVEGSRMTIYDVKKGINGAGDNAVYQCKAENRHGYLWTNFYLNLLAFQPKFLEEPKVYEAIEGRPFNIYCKFFASPMANVTWESPQLLGTEYIAKVDQFGTGSLMFEKIYPSHEGEYKCTGANKYGSISGNVRLIVRKPTSVQPFDKKMVELQAGTLLKLNCEANHDPNLEPTYVWTLDGRPLEEHSSDSHFKILNDHSLLIESPREDDSGIYKCTVSTSLDRSDKSIEVLIEDVPPAVQSASIAVCNKDNFIVRIKFEHVEQAYRPKPVREFWIRYMSDPEVDSGKWTIHQVPVLAMKSEVIDDNLRIVRGDATLLLKPYGMYIFQIIARNEIGDSAPFQLSQKCETGQKAPDRNPTGVRVEGSQPDNLIVYWDPMPRDEWNAENFAYKILYRKQGERGKWTEIEVEDPFSDKHTIDLGDQQHPWDPYEVMVKAVNSKGPSLIDPLVVVGRSGEGDPGVIVTKFHARNIKATSADFHWEAVDPSKVQGNFTGYKITYWHENENNGDYDVSDDDGVPRNRRSSLKISRRGRSSPNLIRSSTYTRQSIFVPPSATHVTVTNLKPNTMNYAYITVTNGQNEGAASEEISFRTKEGVPSEVRKLNAYAVNNKFESERAVVFLNWKPPRNPNGNLTHYLIVRCLRPSPDEQAHSCDHGTDVPIGTIEFRLTGLEYSTNYQFRVYAFTRAGKGLPNSADCRTLPEALRLDLDPVRPSLIHGGIGEDHFNVSFVPGTYDELTERPIGNEFYIKYRETNIDSAWKAKYPSKANTLDLTVDGLTPGTKYDVVAVAVQKDGQIRREYESRIHHITTNGVSPHKARIFWILVVLLVLLILLFLTCVICLLVRGRGRKYPLAEKERLHGRDPVLAQGQRTFEEYGRISDDEKRSLTGHSHASESDSMAEFVETDPRNFDEDGSFINQYGPGKTALVVTSMTPRQPT